jgi:hypothetical protein
MLDPNTIASNVAAKLPGLKGLLGGDAHAMAPAAPAMQLPSGTPYAQMLRQQLLANILKR